MGTSHFSISAENNRRSQEPCVVTVFVFLSHLNKLPWHLQAGGVKTMWIGVPLALTRKTFAKSIVIFHHVDVSFLGTGLCF